MQRPFKNEIEIDLGLTDLFEFIEADDFFNFVIKASKPSDSGMYSVKLINDAGEINSNKAQLTVKCN